ncbi:hypothetical protein UFOVP723_148 [uncultured Caudovirales phage]|uniref:Uncharacterized protein n=1 Tax=uncultured Caudovirales phage TaxID=2100421 RepID=A0A6J5NTB0_9CAUD|nr:hypothetical protein UFOVP723_148 [uncultured Caudovirales phage]
MKKLESIFVLSFLVSLYVLVLINAIINGIKFTV